MNILAIETSCDETAAAVVTDGTKILSTVVATSADMYRKYGGVVPEIAARQQLTYILPVLHEALAPFGSTKGKGFRRIIEKEIDAIAVTIGPGLIGSLLIGVETARTMAFVTGKPLIPVNHVLAHMYANFVLNEQNRKSQSPISDLQNTPGSEFGKQKEILFPAISLVVSGGHTELYLMESEKKLKWLGGTLDDAAGEAFDKTARLLGFGTGGGVAIQNAAGKFKMQNAKRTIQLPRPMLHDETLNFSFSGLKTAINREYNKLLSKHSDDADDPAVEEETGIPDEVINELAYEVQESITDVLVGKTLRAAQLYNAKSVLLSGGVSANLRLREKFLLKLDPSIHSGSTLSNVGRVESQNPNPEFHVPPVNLCTDNAVYIASYAYFRGNPEPWPKINAQPDLSVEEI